MESIIKIIRKSELVTNHWSGGTTTQLMIYPEDASYSERNFKWRISSAKVMDEESLFTILPGISRAIMIIQGEIVLEHEGRGGVALKPFEEHRFMGDWKTKSFGKVTDFNLMMSRDCSGRLEAMLLQGNKRADILLKENIIENEKACKITNAFYIVNGDVTMTIKGREYEINQGDLISVTIPAGEHGNELSFINKGDREINIIRSVVCY